MAVNLELYRVFCVVAKHGSITAAAKELYISQSAVSQSIKQLEAQLGGRLFLRTPRGTALTSEGAACYEYARRAIDLIHEAENKFAQMKELLTGSVRIGTGDTFLKHRLLDSIREFHSKYPDVVLHVSNRTTPETINLLRSGHVDVGFVNLPVEDAELDIMHTTPMTDCFVCRPGYIADEPISLAALAELPLLMLEQASNSRRQVDKFFLTHGVALSPQIELSSLDSLCDFAKIGLGISCVTREFILHELEAGELYEVRLETPMPERSIGAAALKGVPLPFAARRFVDELGF